MGEDRDQFAKTRKKQSATNGSAAKKPPVLKQPANAADLDTASARRRSSEKFDIDSPTTKPN
jgi:hypothetical protein